jgi:CarD family transcriptional regulator
MMLLLLHTTSFFHAQSRTLYTGATSGHATQNFFCEYRICMRTHPMTTIAIQKKEKQPAAKKNATQGVIMEQKRGALFKIGDMAVYPSHGVGVIDAIESKNLSGKEQKFYILRLLSNGMTIMIPTDNVEQVGLRGIVASREISKVYKILKEKTAPSDSQTWNRRYREYMEKIRTGSAFEVAEVLRDLLLLRIGKDLSFGERRMLDMAKGLLVKELSIAQKSPEDRIEKHIEALFA